MWPEGDDGAPAAPPPLGEPPPPSAVPAPPPGAPAAPPPPAPAAPPDPADRRPASRRPPPGAGRTLDDRWRRLHPVTILRELLGVAWNVTLAVVAFGALQGGAAAGLEVLAPALLFAFAAARYLSTSYRITSEAVLYRRGVLIRQRVEVPRDRIQNVASGADVLGRLFGLRTVSISTAGSEGEVELALVTAHEASFLLAELLGDRPAGPAGATGSPPTTGSPGPATAPAPRLLVSLPGRHLVLYALTGTGFVGAVALGGFMVASVVSGSAGPLALVPLLGAARAMTALDLADFRLYAEADRIRVRHGLLKTRDKWARRERIQVLAIERPLLRTALGFETISVATADATVAGDSTLSACHPMAARGRWPDLAAELLERPGIGEDDLRPISPRARVRRTLRLTALAAVVAAPAAVVAGLAVGPPGPAAVAVGLVAAAAVAWALAGRAQRLDGYALDPDHVLIRRGLVASRLWLVRRAKVQSATVVASPFQRRLGLASVLVDTANVSGGTMVVPDLPADEAGALAAELVALADRVFLPDGV